jgi:hypothetical protein
MNLPELQQRLESLAKEVETLREGLRRAFALTDSDPEMSLLRTRMVLETIIHDRYQRYMGEPGTQPHENLLQKLVREGHFPRHLEGYADAVRKLGNVSAHPAGVRYTSEDVHRALVNLLPIVEWYMQETRAPKDVAPQVSPKLGQNSEADRKTDRESQSKQNTDSSATTGVNIGTLFDAATTSVASKIADGVCADIEKIFTIYDDRDEALRFTKNHLEAEIQDAEEGIASCEGSKQGAAQGKKDANSALASAFQISAYATIVADLKKKKRSLQTILRELDSLANSKMEKQEILGKLSQLVRIYLK